MTPWRVAGQAVCIASIVVLAGFWGIWRQFADRIPPRAHIGSFAIGGIRTRDVSGAIAAYKQDFLASSMTINLRGKDVTHTLAELGVQLNTDAAIRDVSSLQGSFMPLRSVRVLPVVLFMNTTMQLLLEKDFQDVLPLPKNPTLAIQPDFSVTIIPGAAGEVIDILSLNRDIAHAVIQTPYDRVLANAIRAVPNKDVAQLEEVRAYVQGLLDSGFSLVHHDEKFPLSQQDIAAMIRFTGISAGDIAFDADYVRTYLNREIAPKVNRDALNARFEIRDGRVSQFALPQDGEDIDIDASVRAIEQALISRASSAQIVSMQKPPLLSDVESATALGITSRLAKGETDFKGSPKNRIHNIVTGIARYHGLLIAPGQEFSFNEFLGSVTAEAGFKPELVIKNNVTTPEFGGGLCQVSTTLFRAAVYAGMKITVRRNHSYAVRYYGTPGFDATIYPPYTDFRFLNNTPGYLLIQTNIDGTRLSFELWGTDDGRQVTVDGPHPYGKQPNGALKATLKQTVTKGGQTLIEDTFKSNYKSPQLFPRV